MILAVTGHRPPKIGGYSDTAPLRVAIRTQLRDILLALQPEFAISGMALGVDQDFAAEALALKIPLIAAVPFRGQELAWPSTSQQHFHALLAQAAEVVYVSTGGYAAWKMQRRNEWMVDHCDQLIAVWDGSSGGTAHCVRYAESRGRDIIRINPIELPLDEVVHA